jgi:hypothetical protein
MEWSRVGFSQDLIAQKLGISKPTLEKYYRQELDFAEMDMVGSVGSALYANAMAGNVQAQIFIMKTRAGWRETERIEHTGADGSPLVTNLPDINVNFKSPSKPGGAEE